MGDLATLLLLIVLLAIAGSWLRLSRAREKAVVEAKQRCKEHGLQLLDETVGLSGMRMQRFGDRFALERRYSFEVSIDGNDRESGHIWIVGDTLTALALPTIELYTPERSAATSADDSRAAEGNVLQFRPRRDGRDLRH